MKVIYFSTRGTTDPTGASIPLHLAANGSLEIGHDVGVVLGGDATEMIVGSHLEEMAGVGLPPVRELVTKLKDRGVPFYV